MTLDYPKAPTAANSFASVVRALADEFIGADVSVEHEHNGETWSLDLIVTGRTCRADLTVTSRPSTQFRFSRI